MEVQGCSETGEVDNSKFGEPMPWISLYIAAASLALSLLVAINTSSGFRRWGLWFPSEWFSLNATSLTLLSVATKLPVDLNTTMPRRHDQLTKLSGTVLICTTMADLMISLGSMDGSEMLSNIIALGVLVIIVIVNIGIQMGTGVIYVFLPEHAIIMSFTLVLLVYVVSSAIAISTARKLLAEPVQSQDSMDGYESKEMLETYCLMVFPSRPQYLELVAGHSSISTASGVVCLFSALILLQAAVRSFFPGSFNFCHGESDYKWSIMLVLISQAICVGVAIVAPVIRGFRAAMARRPHSCKVEKYWVLKLEEWRGSSLPSNTRSWHLKISRFLKKLPLNVCIFMQTGLVFICKLIRLVCALPAICLCRLFSCCCHHCRRGLESLRPKTERRRMYYRHLEGEEHLFDQILQICCLDVAQWVQMGRENAPTDLIKFLEGFRHLPKLDGDPDFSTEWAFLYGSPVLLVITAATIAVALLPSGSDTVQTLKEFVRKGLCYMSLEDEGDGLFKRKKILRLINDVWSAVDSDDQWLGLDLKENADKSEREKIKILQAEANDIVSAYREGEGQNEEYYRWPASQLAANCMRGVSTTILNEYENKFETDGQLFEWLQTAIIYMLGCCLYSLPDETREKFSRSPVTESEVRKAAYLVGEAEAILENFPDV